MDQRVTMSSEMKNAIMVGSVQQVEWLLDTDEMFSEFWSTG